MTQVLRLRIKDLEEQNRKLKRELRETERQRSIMATKYAQAIFSVVPPPVSECVNCHETTGPSNLKGGGYLCSLCVEHPDAGVMHG